MALFDYTGQLRSGATFQGTLEADSQDRAARILADMAVLVTSLRPARRAAYVAALSLDDFQFFNEQVAAITRAQIPLEEGFRQLAADVGSRKLKRLLLDLSDDLAAGTPLPEALAKQHRRFPTHYAGVVKAGLETGDLGGTLYSVARHLRLKSGVRRALLELTVYPVVILSFAMGVLSFLMRTVVPEIEALVREVGGDMLVKPGQVRVRAADLLFATADSWPTIELVIGGSLLALVLIFAVTFLPGGRPAREWILLHVPGIRQVYWSSVLARFTHTSALAAFSARPLPDLLRSAGAASGSCALARAADRASDRLTQGDSLADAAGREADIPALWTCVVSATAPRGELPSALSELARSYETRADQWVRMLRILLGPILLLLVAGFLATIVLAVGAVFSRITNAMMYF